MKKIDLDKITVRELIITSKLVQLSEDTKSEIDYVLNGDSKQLEMTVNLFYKNKLLENKNGK